MKRYFTILQNTEITSIAIGRFDGLHVGHKALIDKLTSNAALVIVEKEQACLTPNEYRCRYTNLDCIFLDFDEIKNFSAMEFVAFLKDIFINLKRVVVGYDFRFSKFASAGAKDLKELFDGEVVVVSEVKFDDISVHSKDIKQMIQSGEIESANALLGREYEIFGVLIKGQGLGSKELFATLNIDYGNFLTPKNGVYDSMVTIDDKEYKAATFVGNRLSTDGKFSIETHLLDTYIENVEGEISIKFKRFIRENQKFDNLNLLKEQIALDLTLIRSI
jgi:riboflavin kinase/FMN adenylyltransferase